MKTTKITIIIFLICSFCVKSQITINPGGSASSIVNTLVANGISVSNISINCNSSAYGTFTGNLQAGGSQLSNGGIILTTGTAAAADGPNNSSSSTTSVSGYDFSDPDLTTQPGSGNPPPNNDNCVLEFDMSPSCSQFNVSFVFGSEEYPEFVSSSYNDGFGIFITGPNPSGGNYNAYNMARLPNGQLVSIDNVNSTTNSNYYNTNTNNVTQYDGYTDGLTAQLNVIPCSTYRVKIIIADAGDQAYDSGLFLGAGSFSCSVPALVVTASPTSVCSGQSTTLTATTSASGGTFSWSSSPAGFNGSTATVTVNPTATTTYTCNYTLSGCSSVSSSVTITVSPGTTPTFTQVSPVCSGSAISPLPTTSTNGITGTWSPAIDNLSTTTYTFTPASGQCASSQTMTITIIPSNTVTNPGSVSACTNTVISNIVHTTTGATGINSDGISGANGLPSGVSATWSNGTITLNGTITSSSGSSFNYSIPLVGGCGNVNAVGVINVIQDNFVSAASANPNLCVDSPISPVITFSTNGATGIGSTSGLPDGVTASFSNNTIIVSGTPSNIGSFNYSIPLVGGCGNVTASGFIIVNPLITPLFNQLGPLCQNSVAPSLPTSTSNTPSIAGTWNPSTINSSSIGNSTYTFTPSSGQCADIATMEISIINLPNPIITADITNGCSPLQVTLGTDPLSGTNYEWQSNGSFIGSNQSIQVTFNNIGCYDISLKITGSGCSSSTLLTDYICVESNPIVSFTASPNVLVNSSENVKFTNNTSGATSYLWNFGDSTSSNEINPFHLYTNISENIPVTLTAFSESGCIGTYSLVLNYNEPAIFYVPNSFTPDQDEFNQTWGPVFTQGFDPYNFDLYVFNRWGELIWESHDTKGRWDGTYGSGGIRCPDGVFTWKISYKPKETDERIIVTGSIRLIR